MTEPAVSTELRRLTSLRFGAAVLVFLYHLALTLLGWRPARLFSFGATGVGFFFILSGFVLTYSAGTVRPGRFYLRRFARIYPSMLVAFIIAVVLAAAVPGLQLHTGTAQALASSFTVQAWFPTDEAVVYAYNPVAWSLSVEAFFYALFPLLLRVVRSLRPQGQVVTAGFLLGAGAVVTVVFHVRGFGNTVGYVLPVMRLPEFVAGIVLALRVRAGWRPRWSVGAAAGLAAVAALVSRELPAIPLQDYVMLVPWLALIAAAAAADLRDTPGWLTHRWAVHLGRTSFCFYLTHLLLLDVLTRALHWRRDWSLLGGTVPLLVSLLLAVLAAAGLHRFVERPAARAVVAAATRVEDFRRAGPPV